MPVGQWYSMPRSLIGSAVLLALSSAAMAADLPAAAPSQSLVTAPTRAALWTITIGVEGRVLPSFEGANSYTVAPIPMFSIRRAGTPVPFDAPRDGFGFSIIDTGQFQAGPAFKVDLPRREGSNSDLRGLSNVDWTLEAGAFAQYWVTPWLRARAELRQGIGGEAGLTSDLTADVVVPLTSQVTLSGGPRMTLESNAATSPYFSITQTQSTHSGLPVYDAHGGVHSYGAGAQVRYAWSPQWATHVFVEYERLSGDAADSPLVALRGSRDQVQTGIGLAYSFDMPGFW
jgi:outer membrane protein